MLITEKLNAFYFKITNGIQSNFVLTQAHSLSHSIKMSILYCGAPHFKSAAKQHRQANYNFIKVLNELVDNVIKKGTEIRITTQVDDNQQLQSVSISDNYYLGFQNLDKMGVNNPFNMGYIASTHDDDRETSEFGVGMKAGAVSAANELRAYTRSQNPDGTHYYKEVICDFIRMEAEEDVSASYNPRINEITQSNYEFHHPFARGSTVVLSKIRGSIYPRTTQEKITEDLCKHLSITYSRLILERGVEIKVNGTKVEPAYDFFEDPKCAPFCVEKELHVLEVGGGSREYIMKKTADRTTWQKYGSDNKWHQLSDGESYMAKLVENGYTFVYVPGSCLTLRTTFTLYSDKYHNPAQEFPMTEDALSIYKDNRLYGNKSLFTHNNGIHNYTKHDANFVSKSLGKDLGITYNKEITMNGTNELTMVIKSALEDSKRGFSADTSTGVNAKLCKKAIDCGIIDRSTCPKAKLASMYRQPDASSNSSDDASVSSKPEKKTKPKKQAQAPEPKEPAQVQAPEPKEQVQVQEPEQKEQVQAQVPEPKEQVQAQVPATPATQEQAPEQVQVQAQVPATPATQEQAPEQVQEQEQVPEPKEPEQKPMQNDKALQRTIAIIVRLKELIAEECELSENTLSIIEMALSQAPGLNTK